jgi:hypothetical protein
VARQSTAARVLRCTKHDGENDKTEKGHGGAHIGQQISWQAAVAAHGGGAAPLGLGDGGG